jgi:hypothetical protein
MKLLLLLMLSLPCFGQVGFTAGSMSFLGDLQGNKGVGKTFLKDVNLINLRPTIGVFYSFPLENFSVRAGINYGTIHGADSLITDRGSDERFRKQRNLSFHSVVIEGYAAIQYDIGLFYALAGLGVVYFNPTTMDQGNKVFLLPLMTENISYKNFTLGIPIGGGVRLGRFSLEAIHRFTLTDHMDDVSTVYTNRPFSFRELQTRNYIGEQRGDPKEKDGFFTVSLTYTLPPSVPYLKCPKNVY